MESTHDSICKNQLAWAKSQGINIEAGYTLRMNDNLFMPLTETSLSEFRSGKGGELGDNGARGKIQALHSSAALVVNVFEYWRTKNDIGLLAEACGATQKCGAMSFEVKHKNPISRIPSHLDVEFTGARGGRPLAIESKFTECYDRHTRRTLSPSYLKKKETWKGLPRCEALAHRLVAENGQRTSFAYLDAPQLLKHILGLVTDFGPSEFQLLYLWYGTTSFEAEEHRTEIAEFERCIGDEVDFEVMTYQDLFTNVSQIADVAQDYLHYLRQRYFRG